MGDIRFGTSINRPFCVPNRELTAQEAGEIFRRFAAQNPELPKVNQHLLAAVIGVKAYPCTSN
jgi:hypothetical protein